MSNQEDQYVSDIREESIEEDEVQLSAEAFGVLSSEGSDEIGPQSIDADALANEMLAASGVDWGLGPLRIEARLSGATIRVTISLLGVRIASATLSTRNPTLRVSANVQAARAEVEVRADFTRRTLSVAGRVCVRVPPFRWRCRSFRLIILRW
jgi:hypothetical protein